MIWKCSYYARRAACVLCVLSVLAAALRGAEPVADPAGKPAPPVERPGWKLVWSDEFDKDGLPDPAKWDYETGFVRNGELQYYTAGRSENARVENGTLVIEARKENFPNPNYDKSSKDPRKSREFLEYTSASLTTAKTASWTYGHIEVRAKLPAGKGTWPAIWMLGKNIGKAGWPGAGEIDIMENVGFDPSGIHTTIHTKAYNHVKNTAKGHRISVSRPSEVFHTYAVDWSEKEIVFLVDDQKVFEFENDGKGNADTWPYDKPQYLLMNFAFGGGWGGAKGVDPSIMPQKFVIDYVRVYEKVEEK